MTDKLLDRIKAHRAAPDVYDRADFLEMEARILTDAKIIKAAEEYIIQLEAHEGCESHSTSVYQAAAAYRAAVSERDT